MYTKSSAKLGMHGSSRWQIPFSVVNNNSSDAQQKKSENEQFLRRVGDGANYINGWGHFNAELVLI